MIDILCLALRKGMMTPEEFKERGLEDMHNEIVQKLQKDIDILQGDLPHGDDHVSNCMESNALCMLSSLLKMLTSTSDKKSLHDKLTVANEKFVDMNMSAKKQLAKNPDEHETSSLKEIIEDSEYAIEHHVMFLGCLSVPSLFDFRLKKLRSEVSEVIETRKEELHMICELKEVIVSK